MKTIHKYPVTVETEKPFAVEMPKAAELLHVLEHPRDGTFLYALVDTDMEQTQRTFQWFGTGRDWSQTADDNKLRQYVGTITHAHGAFVWHLFEVRE